MNSSESYPTHYSPQPKGKVMNITLNQTEIEKALRNFIIDMGVTAEVHKIQFTAGRGSTGITAELALDEEASEVPSAPEVEEAPELTKTSKPFSKAAGMTQKANPTSKAKAAAIAKEKEGPEEEPEPETEKEATPELPVEGEELMDTPEAATTTEEETKPAKSKSLFGGA